MVPHMDVKHIDITSDNNAQSTEQKNSLDIAKDEVTNKRNSAVHFHYKVVNTTEEFFESDEKDEKNETNAKDKRKSKSKNTSCFCISKNNGNKD